MPIIMAACVLSLCLSVALLGYTGRDDSHITYFVAQNVADGQGLINYNGDRVEQSSTLSWPLLLALAARLTGLEVATLGPFVSFSFLLLGVGVAAAIARRARLSPLAPLGLVGIPIVYWSLSGMENSLYLFLYLLLGLSVLMWTEAAARHDRRAARFPLGGLVAAISAGLALTRPEYLPVVALVAVLLPAMGGRAWRDGAQLSALLLLGAAVAVGGRLLAGLELFPNTVYAKSSDPPLAENLRNGLGYLFATMRSAPFSTAVAAGGFILGLVHLRRLAPSPRRAPLSVFLAVSAAIGAFAIVSGGDWMEAGRFVAVPMALAAFVGFAVTPARWSVAVVPLVLAAMLVDAYRLAAREFGGLPFFARYDYVAQTYTPSPMEAFNVIHARDLSFVDRALPVLEAAAGPDGEVTVASIQGGMVPFYLDRELGARFYFVDFRGLTTRHVHDCWAGDGWRYQPYADIPGLQACTGRDFDFVFDTDRPGWRRLAGLLEIGCREVFREELRIDAGPDWKRPMTTFQFLVDCR